MSFGLHVNVDICLKLTSNKWNVTRAEGHFPRPWGRPPCQKGVTKNVSVAFNTNKMASCSTPCYEMHHEILHLLSDWVIRLP